MTIPPALTAASARTIPAHLAHRVAEDPDRHLAGIDGAWFTVDDLHGRARRLAAGLASLGVRPGDRVASIMANRAESYDVFFACAELGAIHVPLNIFLKGEFLRYQLADADPKVLIVDSAGEEAATPLIAEYSMDVELVAVDDPRGDVRPFASLLIDADRSWSDPTPDSLLSILYTSGTTGLPKGCVMTQGYFMHFPLAHQMFQWFTPTDISISTLPLYHGFGLSGLMNAVLAGTRINFESTFSASTYMSRARDVGATQIWAVGAIGMALLATPASDADRDHSVERAVFLPMSPAAQQAFEERFGITVLPEGYGQTEVLPATMSGPRRGRDKASAGRRLPWLDVQAVDAQDRPQPVGVPGEIVVRPLEPYSMFSGYWRKEAATIEAWRNLWHHTGDLGYFDEDGMLYFVDRKKDALRRRGENVSSVELETAILRSPDIAQVAIHAAPSELSEDEIKACIVLEPGASPTPEELFAFFKTNLPYYAVPRYIQIMDALPVNAVGRVLKHQLRDDWNAPGTLDLEALGLTIDRSSRR